MDNAEEHWDRVYSTKASSEVSWTQERPSTSLNFIHSFNLPRNVGIIDVGGGESRLVDCLLDEGFLNVSVLDISKKALERAKIRLGERADLVRWIVGDITKFVPDQTYGLWHDRATFHFLTTEEDIRKYVSIASSALVGNGVMSIGTFSEHGPSRCSGLAVRKYSETTLQSALAPSFTKVRCVHEDHVTPFNTVQNFIFCSFARKERTYSI